MKKAKFNGHVLELYDSIQELPVTRFQMYNLNTMLDAGIGSDLSAYDQHVNRSVQYINAGQKESAITELRNKQQSVHFIMSNTSPEYNSFCAMIYKIDGREILDEDLTESGVQEIMKELGRKKFSIFDLRRIMKYIKKKIEFETQQFFPNLIDDTIAKELFGKLKIRTDYLLEGIQKGFDKYEEHIKKIDDYILSLNKPQNYSGAKGLEVTMIKNFEQTCTLFEFHKLSIQPKKLTTLSFLEKTVALKQLLKKHKK